MIQRPSSMGTFQFVVLATLRAAQLMRGCTPRVLGDHKATIIAQSEVAQGKVIQSAMVSLGAGEHRRWAIDDAAKVVQPT